MNRAEAAWELVKKDRASEPGKITFGGVARDVAVKGYDAFSSVVPAALGFISDNQFEVVPRSSPIAGTIQAVRSTLKARWFKKGNPLNLVAKAVTGMTEGTDGVIQDLLHIGHSKEGYVVRTAA